MRKHADRLERARLEARGSFGTCSGGEEDERGNIRKHVDRLERVRLEARGSGGEVSFGFAHLPTPGV